MHTYKRTDDIVRSMGHFVAFQVFTKILLSLITISTIFITSFLYQKFAFDYIEIIAYEQQATFNLKVISDQQEINQSSLSTPYLLKVPRGEKIVVEISDQSNRICGKLKNGNSYVQVSMVTDELTLQRDGNYFKGECL